MSHLHLVQTEPAPIDPARITDALAARTFIRGGNATFTLRSGKTGMRFTYKAALSDDGSLYFVSVLTGPDNEADFRYLGIIRGDDFMRTKKSTIGADAPSHIAFVWTWRKLVQGELPNQLEIWHEGRCGRCGRKLTVPESVASGFGPECIQHVR